MFYFPMAGLSSRFTVAGYDRPKYYLKIGNLSLFQASLNGFSRYFETDGFCFIYLEKFINEHTIREWADAIGLPKSNCFTVPLLEATKGQAETVKLGVEAVTGSVDNTEEVIIFNIDTVYHDFKKPNSSPSDYLDVTRMPGTHWSFVEPYQHQSFRVKRVAEKERISDLCSVGLYGFRSSKSFSTSYKRFYFPGHSLKEEYVAPIYQKIIDQGIPVEFREFPNSRFQFLGTPEDYEKYLNNETRLLGRR